MNNVSRDDPDGCFPDGHDFITVVCAVLVHKPSENVLTKLLEAVNLVMQRDLW